MPDPFEYLKAVLAAVVASTTILLLFRLRAWKQSRVIFETANVVAMTCGAFAGYFTLNFPWPWPPANALDRFLTIVLPAILTIEFVTAIADNSSAIDSAASALNHRNHTKRTSCVLVWITRCLLCCVIGRILMHGSIYLDGLHSSTRERWLIQNLPCILLVSSLLLIGMWFALTQLAKRAASSGIVVSLGVCLICAGCTTMMAGYIKGGAAALPLATVLFVSAFASHFPVSARIDREGHFNPRSIGTAAIGIGLVSLFSLVWVGRFFGQLTSGDALLMFLAPLLCWVGEFPAFRKRSAAAKFALQVIAVLVPLTILLVNAKREFDEKMGPLL